MTETVTPAEPVRNSTSLDDEQFHYVLWDETHVIVIQFTTDEQWVYYYYQLVGGGLADGLVDLQ